MNAFYACMGGIVGFVFGMIIGLGLASASWTDHCREGWFWKDIDYVYSCKAEKRP